MKDNLISTIRNFLIESADETERRKRLFLFFNQVIGFSGPIRRKYEKAFAHFKNLKSVSDIQSETHENGLVSTLIQIAQDPLSNTIDHTIGDNLKEQIVNFLKQFYPLRAKEVEEPGTKGSLGGAGVQYENAQDDQVNTIPYKYPLDTERSSDSLPKLADPSRGLFPSNKTHPNEYVSRIYPMLRDAADKNLTIEQLIRAVRNQFGVRIENLPIDIVRAIKKAYTELGGAGV